MKENVMVTEYEDAKKASRCLAEKTSLSMPGSSYLC